jgi:anti-sigma factor ChrR (cupin superfamily)
VTGGGGGNSLVIGAGFSTLAGVVAQPPPLSPDPSPLFPRVALPELFDIEARQHTIPWEYFRDGVEIHRLYGDGETGPTAALLRFSKASKVPLHEHIGYEHILVLAGTQSDCHGSSGPGTLIVNPPGTRHSVISDAGCIVLAIYEKPVRFLSDE